MTEESKDVIQRLHEASSISMGDSTDSLETDQTVSAGKYEGYCKD